MLVLMVMGKMVTPYFGAMETPWFRLGGPGLANLLFPWARAILHAEKTNATFLPPVWFSINPGALKRGDFKNRNYGSLFRKTSCLQSVWRSCYLLFGGHAEDTQLQDWNGLMVFKGLGEFFFPLSGKGPMLLKRLQEVSCSGPNNFDLGKNEYVAFHIRRGDYSETMRTSLQWFVDQKKALETSHLSHLPVLIYSDGNEEELRDLVEMNNVYRVNGGNALTDLLGLAHGKLVVGSHSSFSEWGAFMSDGHMVRPPAHYETFLFYGENRSIFESITDLLNCKSANA